MIRIALISKHYQQIEPLIHNILDQNNIEYRLSNYRHQSMQDIYFIENGYLIKDKFNPRVDYLEIINDIYFKELKGE